jgi:flagellar biosynthesis GTPase FlhF
MKCNNCNKEFEGRSDAKFCSTKCRVAFNRRIDNPAEPKMIPKSECDEKIKAMQAINNKLVEQIEQKERELDEAISQHFQTPSTQTRGIESYVQQPPDKESMYRQAIFEATTQQQLKNIYNAIASDKLPFQLKSKLYDVLENRKNDLGFIYGDRG